MTEEPKKEEIPSGPKKILEELEKSAAAPEPVPAEVAPQPPLPVEPAASAAPLITDAMRRLDDLLARFRTNS